MSETGEHLPPEVLIEAVRDEQNRWEEGLREDFLADHLFHLHHVSVTFQEQREQLEQEFLRDKKGKNMGERLELALQESYLGVINVVELGMTTRPSADGEIDGLKHEYNELRRWMIINGWIDDEMSREESGRTLDVRFPDATKEYVVIGRNRPLVSTEVDVNIGHDRTISTHIGVAKRMVFSIPVGLYLAINRRFDDPSLKKEETIAFVEDMLQQHAKKIHSIRTSYYLSAQVI